MCGIVGLLGEHHDGVFQDMLESIEHRGPDSKGEFYDEDDKVMMGAQRLAINDISGGDQPISNEEGTVNVVFNGEIYNYHSLKEDLEEKGHNFSTDCDTEVLVHLWEEHGTNLPKLLDGMFAFSLWDSKKESLFLARDRFGIKPLFYTKNKDFFGWGSEILPLLKTRIDKTLSERAVYNYFYFRYSPWPETLFKNIRKVPPGSSILISDDSYDVKRYWRLNGNEPYNKIGKADSIKKIRELLEESVEKRLMADVPVGAFLSGGLDSSSIVSLMSEKKEKVRTFSIGFQGNRYDESEEAGYLSNRLGTEHSTIEVDLNSMDVFDEVISHFGEPIADPAILPTQILSEFASNDVKTVMSGEGGDEVFIGYSHYTKINKHKKYGGSFPKFFYRFAGEVGKLSPIYGDYLKYFSSIGDDKELFLEWARRHGKQPEEYLDLSDSQVKEGPKKVAQKAFLGVEEEELLKKAISFDLNYWMPDNLLYKLDHSTMAASLEGRVPFLDHHLVNLVYNLPLKYKVNGSNYKPLLKQAMKDKLPDRILKRKKQGFSLPIDRWFRNDHDSFSKWFSAEKIQRTPYVDTEVTLELKRAHENQQTDSGMLLWKIMNYVAWYHKIVLDNKN